MANEPRLDDQTEQEMVEEATRGEGLFPTLHPGLNRVRVKGFKILKTRKGDPFVALKLVPHGFTGKGRVRASAFESAAEPLRQAVKRGEFDIVVFAAWGDGYWNVRYVRPGAAEANDERVG